MSSFLILKQTKLIPTFLAFVQTKPISIFSTHANQTTYLLDLTKN